MKPAWITRNDVNGLPVLDRRDLWSGSGVTVKDSRWVRSRHFEGRTEGAVGPGASFVLMQAGVYTKTVGKREAVGDAAHVTLYNHREICRVEHPVGPGTRGTTLSLERSAMEALFADRLPRGTRVSCPFAALSVPVSPSSYLLQAGLVAYLLEADPPDDLLVGDALTTLLHRLGDDVWGGRAPVSSAAGERLEGRVRELQVWVAANHAQRHRLDDLARRVGCTPWHLSRVFKRVAGVSLSRYVRRHRLRAAAGAILDGADDLARVAMDCGFASHSHLTDSFRREFDLAPRDLRRASRERLVRLLAEARDAPGRPVLD